MYPHSCVSGTILIEQGTLFQAASEWIAMKRDSYLVLVGLLSITGLVLASSLTKTASSAIVWTETFDELNYDLWTTRSCTVEDGTLRGVPPPPPPYHISAAIAYRESTVSVGTWKFDFLEKAEWSEELDIGRVYFMSTELETANWTYYCLSITHGGGVDGVRLVYALEKYIYPNPKIVMASFLGEPDPISTTGTQHHFMITRTSGGTISVYLNSSLIMQTTDSSYDSSEYFGYYAWHDWALDNITVYNTIETGLGTMEIVAIGGIAVVIIGLVVFARRTGRI